MASSIKIKALSRNSLDISIIVVNYNSYDILFQCLDTLSHSVGKLKAEIIVIDNTEPERQKNILKNIAGIKLPLTLHYSKKNLGYAGGVNIGIRKSRGRYLAVVNPDIRALTPGLLKKLYDYTRSNRKIGLVAPKLYLANGDLDASCRTFPGPYVLFYKRIPILKSLPIIKDRVMRHMMGDYDHFTPSKVDWVSGAFMFIRKSALRKVGLMDERYFLYMEDVDWCRQFWQNDYQVWYYPKCESIHFARRLSTQFGFLGFFRRISWIHFESYLKYFIKFSVLKNRARLGRKKRGVIHRWRSLYGQIQSRQKKTVRQSRLSE